MIEAPSSATHVLLPGRGKRAPREIAHPLPPELLVAHLSGELPPAADLAVREHLAECDACATRAHSLAGAYGTLATLATHPVAFVPDLRRPVRESWARAHVLTRLARALRVLGGGTLAAVAACVAMVLVLTLFVVTNAFQAPVILARSSNGASALGTVAGSGLLYAETSKVMDVTAPDGTVWPVAEVIAVDERTAGVVLSLPRTASNLRIGRASEFPLALALSPDGRTLYELSAQRQGRQALLAFDAHAGQLLFATPLTQPGGQALPPDLLARTLAVAPDNGRIYIGLSGSPSLSGDPEVLVLAQPSGAVVALLHPLVPSVVFEPPPAGGLPGIPAPRTGPGMKTTSLLRSSVGDALVVSADGRSLFDVVALYAGPTPVALVVRQIAASSGQTTQSLALPGSFALAEMAAGQSASTQLLYLVQVGNAGGVYVITVAGAGLAAHSEIPLGGLSVPPHGAITGTVAVSPTANGTRAYISADTSSAGLTSHDIWLVDSQTNTIASHRIEFATAGQALPNGATGAKALVFVMRGGQIVLLPSDLALGSSPAVWLRLSDGLPLVRLIATSSS